MSLPISRPFAPMDALSVEVIPEEGPWQYEPKWDGFRCLAFRDGPQIELQSKSGQSLTRYFPEIADALGEIRAPRFVLDGELVVPQGDNLSFDHLLMRIHPATSRVQKLAAETPALFIVFDLLVDARGKSLVDWPLSKRREALAAFAREHLTNRDRIRVSPTTADVQVARGWLRSGGGNLDGVIAKRTDFAYRSGDRTGMQKIKLARTADCVVGGFRYGEKQALVGSLLLGLYDRDGLLHHVGFCSGIKAAEKPALTRRLERLVEVPGFTGRAPGGPSRWSTERSAAWKPLRPELVVEVAYDHVSGDRFRHGTRLVRWRPDKAPGQCRMDQLEQKAAATLRLLD